MKQWVWGGPAIALAVQTIIFWWRHRGINDEEFMIYEEEAEAEQVSVEAQGQKKA